MALESCPWVVLSLEEVCDLYFDECMDYDIKRFSVEIEKNPDTFRWYSAVIPHGLTYMNHFKLKMGLRYPHIGFSIKNYGSCYKLKGALLSP